MLNDDSPPKPSGNDAQQTLDTRTPTVTPGISLVEGGPARAHKGPSHISAFSAGDIVAKRFRILRFLAQGGMGEVYEALDIELRQKVALKTVRSALLADVQALERFRQEIVVAKRVTHPNVCRTYDLFRHEAVKPGESDVLIVSMEFLAGETLDHFLKEKGKLSTADVLPLIKQMIAGLAAAHGAGVVHRDFKTNNVMLVPTASGSGPARVVVSDFGLAHSLDPGEFALTPSGEMLGTPAFMAPEQVTGKTITPATDVYSLGVVMFEMITGRLPFAGKNWRELAFKRLEEPAPSPKSFLPQLEERWSRTIQKCLEREPADRFQTVEEVERALVGDTETRLRHEITTRQRRKRLLLGVAGLLMVAVIGMVIGIAFPHLFAWRHSPTVTVLGFKNLSGDSSVDRWGEEFRTNLGTTLDVRQIRFMGPEATRPFWRSQKPSEMPEEPSPESLGTLRKNGCQYAVFGTYMVTGSAPHRQILWNVRLVDTATGESLGSISKNITESDLIDVVASTGSEVREKLGVSLSADDRRGTDRALPANDDASKAYTAGKNQLQNFEFAAAKDSFLAAVQADPNNAEIRSALAQAWWDLGFETKAREEAKRASDLAGSLSGEKNSLIRARYFAFTGKWDNAANLYNALWNINSDNYSYGLLLAESQIEGRHYPEASQTLTNLKTSEIPPLARGETYLLSAELERHLGDNVERLKSAESAVATAKSLRAELLGAHAEIAQCLALLDLGKVEEAPKICADAVELNVKQGDDLGTARAKNAVANSYYSHGDLDRAEPLYTEALAIATRIGDKRDEAGALLNLGNIQKDKNNFSEAKRWYEKSIQVSVERSGINDDLLLAQQGLALVYGSMGRWLDEKRALIGVRDAAEVVGDKFSWAQALLNLCVTQLATGEVPVARANCEQSLELMRETGDKTGQARAQQALADVLLAEGDIAGAEDHYQLALRAQQELDARSDAAYTEASLIDLFAEKRDVSNAEKNAHAALDFFILTKDTTGEVGVRCSLAQAYLETNHPQEAKEQISRAKEHLEELQDASIRATFLTKQAIVANTPKPSLAAIFDLKEVESKTRKAGLLQLALEAKFARVSLLSGDARSSELRAVADEARQHGYLLLARRAEAAARA